MGKTDRKKHSRSDEAGSAVAEDEHTRPESGQATEEEKEGQAPQAPPTAGPQAKKARSEKHAVQSGADDEADMGAARQDTGVVEKGKIIFLYRPKVELEEASSISQVQRFYMILAPAQPGVNARLAVIGKKRLPSTRKHERFFGFIEASAQSPEALTKDHLGAQEYQTKTRGTRHLAPARVLGEGAYTITRHKQGTNLVYQLELPEEPGEVQKDFGIGKLGSFILSVKNPANVGGPPGQPFGLSQKADYSEEKLRKFGQAAWIPAVDTQLLDYGNCEFLLVGAAEEPAAELGEGKAEAVAQVAEEQYGAESDEEQLLQTLKEELKADEVGIMTAPAETGEWK